MIFKDGVELSQVNAETSTVVFFMTGRPSEYSFTVPLEKYAKPSITLVAMTQSVTAKEKDGKIVFDIALKASGKIGSRGNIEEGDSGTVNVVTKAAESELRRIIEDSVIPVAGEGCDVFGLENTIRRCCNKLYNENKDKIGEIIADSEYNVSVDIDIFSLGLNTA